MRDYLIALFSHANVGGVMLWGFWEGRHWRPVAALFERDWTPRPVARAWMDLVHGEWKTDLTLTTDDRGEVHGRGFCGAYDLRVTHGKTSVTAAAGLQRGAAGAQVTVVLGG